MARIKKGNAFTA